MRRVVDALRFATSIVTWPIARRAVQARGDEGRRELPGDELLPNAKDRWTNAISIRARPSEIWPWLVQLGCRRAGWYSYDGLDNGGVRSADQVVPELQQLEVGDVFPWTPDANDGFIVKAVEPERALVLGGDAGSLYRVIWAFVLDPIDNSHTRLLTRSSADYKRPWVGLRLRFAAHPIHFAMQRRQLLNLKRRAERSADRNPETVSCPGDLTRVRNDLHLPVVPPSAVGSWPPRMALRARVVYPVDLALDLALRDRLASGAAVLDRRYRPAQSRAPLRASA